MRRAGWLLLLDAGCVLVFTVIGRASHGEADGVAGLARTAWPFLAGLAVGEVVARAWRRPTATAPGVLVWLVTVGGGQLLRVVSGQGTAAAFVVVSLVFLGVTMLGWRLVARLVARRAGSPRPAVTKRDAGQRAG